MKIVIENTGLMRNLIGDTDYVGVRSVYTDQSIVILRLKIPIPGMKCECKIGLGTSGTQGGKILEQYTN